MTPQEIIQKYGPFPHLLPQEREIWIRWLAGEGANYAPYQYDVRLGSGLSMPRSATDLEKAIALILTQKRVDAISLTHNRVRIFEVKPYAGLAALGQLIGYRHLYIETFGITRPIELWLITDRLQPDMISILDANHIFWREV